MKSSEKAPGTDYLLAAGIFMLLVSVVLLLWKLPGLWGSLAEALPEEKQETVFFLTKYICQGIVWIQAGICGICFCKRREKADFCQTEGILLALLAFLFFILEGVFTGAMKMKSGASVLLPLLYFYGAVKNKKK